MVSWKFWALLPLLVVCWKECPRMAQMSFSPPMRKGEHNAGNFVLCSGAHPASISLLQNFQSDEEVCKVVLTCHFSPEVIFLCQD